MIIKKLELSNFQVIKEFNADFEGNVYFITGDNELGKSTLLKAIGALLTGNRDAVLRNGEDKGFSDIRILTPWSFPGGLKPPRVAESKCNTSGHCCRKMCKNVLPRLTPRL